MEKKSVAKRLNLHVLWVLVTLYSRHHPPGLKDAEDLFGTTPICITWHITILKISDVICQDDSSWSVNMLCACSCLVAINTLLNHFSFVGTPRGLRLSIFHLCQCACNLLNNLIIYLFDLNCNGRSIGFLKETLFIYL